MVDLAEIQTAYYMAAATGVLVAAIYYIINLRHSMKTREMEMCRLSTSTHISEEGIRRYAFVMSMEWEDLKNFMEKYGYSNPEMFGKWFSQFFSYETLGILLRKKIVRAELLYSLGGYSAPWAWEKFKDIIQARRSFSQGQDYMRDFEFLAQEMLKIKMTNDPKFRDIFETYKRTGKL